MYLVIGFREFLADLASVFLVGEKQVDSAATG